MSDPFPLVDISSEITITDKRQLDMFRLRTKVVNAIRFSKHYWLIYKDNTFGVATILDLTYKKAYIEVLFFTDHDVLERGVSIVEISAPKDVEIDWNEVIVDPELDKDDLISPEKTIRKIDNLIRVEVEYHRSLLNLELKLINEHFENYPAYDNIYKRRVRIYFPDFVVKVTVNFEKFPLPPQLLVSKDISDAVSVEELNIIKDWDVDHFAHIFEVLYEFSDEIARIMKVDPLSKDSQLVMLEDVSVGDGIDSIYIRAQRGHSVGIFYELSKGSSANSLAINHFYKAITGEREFSGRIRLFGNHVQSLDQKDLSTIINIQNIDRSWHNTPIQKAIASSLKGISRFSASEKYIKKFIDAVLHATGLMGKKKEKIGSIPELQKTLLSIAMELPKSPRMIMLSIPIIKYNRLEVIKFNKYINIIKNAFHIVVIMHGPKEIVSSCDQVVTITEYSTEVGSIQELVSQIPQSGKMITVGLKIPDPKALEKIESIKPVVVIEERKDEQFRLYLNDDPRTVIERLVHIFGNNLYNFKLLESSLEDYLEFQKLSR